MKLVSLPQPALSDPSADPSCHCRRSWEMSCYLVGSGLHLTGTNSFQLVHLLHIYRLNGKGFRVRGENWGCSSLCRQMTEALLKSVKITDYCHKEWWSLSITGLTTGKCNSKSKKNMDPNRKLKQFPIGLLVGEKSWREHRRQLSPGYTKRCSWLGHWYMHDCLLWRATERMVHWCLHVFGEELETVCESHCDESMKNKAARMQVRVNASYFFLHKSSHPVELWSSIVVFFILVFLQIRSSKKTSWQFNG